MLTLTPDLLQSLGVSIPHCVSVNVPLLNMSPSRNPTRASKLGLIPIPRVNELLVTKLLGPKLCGSTGVTLSVEARLMHILPVRVVVEKYL